MNDNMMLCTKIELLILNYAQGFIISNILLIQTPVKLRSSQIYENYQL